MTQSTHEVMAADESLLQRLVAAVLRFTLKSTLLPAFQSGVPMARQRSRIAAVTKLTLAPRGASYRPGECGGVAGEWVAAKGASASKRAMLYLHGGAYCVGSPATHRVITGQLALRCASRVFAADYRLAPEHPFPAAVDDAVAAYRGLLDAGHAPGDLVIAGDSAGGGLALATAVRLRDLGVPLPGALVVFSPWVDLREFQRARPPAGDIMIVEPWVNECARFYLAGRDAAEPLASPIEADLRGLPRTMIQVGIDEVLLDDSRRLHARLAEAGVPVMLQEYPRRWHVFQVNAGPLADANRALERVAQFVRSGP
jgi:monoterpene epsilon-lactone hydrolase